MEGNVSIYRPKFEDLSDAKDVDKYGLIKEDLEKLEETVIRYENEIKKLRKDKVILHEQLNLIKSFSDTLWDKLKSNQWL